MQNLLEELNPEQKKAVENTEGPCLVIAGAGSGKTKVLTYKIAYLMQEKQVKPWNILAITFTNKAANEMKERVQKLVGEATNDIWLGTFHSICVRILRKFIDRLGFDTSFVIFDTSDQKTLIKNCLKELNIDIKEETEDKKTTTKKDIYTLEDYKKFATMLTKLKDFTNSNNISIDDAVTISLINNYSIDDCLKFKEILESNLN